ncbi:hypothetical protein V8C86DRAFT_2553378 [Haematococcus lacustris]
MKRDDALALAIAIGGPLAGGQLASLIGFKSIFGWYKRLKKPSWNPPNWMFGAVWPLLYTSQGVASWLVWRNKGADRKLPLALYGAQLALNFAWQPLMFKAHRPDLALVDSTAMLGLATAATVAMSKAAGDKKAAVVGLMSPYLAWITFATALNARIWKDNPNAQDIDDTPVDPPGEPTTAAKVMDAVVATTTKATKDLLGYK